MTSNDEHAQQTPVDEDVEVVVIDPTQVMPAEDALRNYGIAEEAVDRFARTAGNGWTDDEAAAWAVAAVEDETGLAAEAIAEYRRERAEGLSDEAARSAAVVGTADRYTPRVSAETARRIAAAFAEPAEPAVVHDETAWPSMADLRVSLPYLTSVGDYNRAHDALTVYERELAASGNPDRARGAAIASRPEHRELVELAIEHYECHSAAGHDLERAALDTAEQLRQRVIDAEFGDEDDVADDVDDAATGGFGRFELGDVVRDRRTGEVATVTGNADGWDPSEFESADNAPGPEVPERAPEQGSWIARNLPDRYTDDDVDADDDGTEAEEYRAFERDGRAVAAELGVSFEHLMGRGEAEPTTDVQEEIAAIVRAGSGANLDGVDAAPSVYDAESLETDPGRVQDAVNSLPAGVVTDDDLARVRITRDDFNTVTREQAERVRAEEWAQLTAEREREARATATAPARSEDDELGAASRFVEAETAAWRAEGYTDADAHGLATNELAAETALRQYRDLRATGLDRAAAAQQVTDGTPLSADVVNQYEQLIEEDYSPDHAADTAVIDAATARYFDGNEPSAADDVLGRIDEVLAEDEGGGPRPLGTRVVECGRAVHAAEHAVQQAGVAAEDTARGERCARWNAEDQAAERADNDVRELG